MNGPIPKKDPLQQKSDAREHLNEEQKKYLTRVKEKAGKSEESSVAESADEDIVEVPAKDNGAPCGNRELGTFFFLPIYLIIIVVFIAK